MKTFKVGDRVRVIDPKSAFGPTAKAPGWSGTILEIADPATIQCDPPAKPDAVFLKVALIGGPIVEGKDGTKGPFGYVFTPGQLELLTQ